MPNVRIKDQTTDTALTTGDYVIVDSETEGTRKYDLGALAARVEALEQGGSGLTQAEKQLILTLFCKAAYAEDDAGVVYDALEAMWASSTKTITYNLSNVSSSNTQASIESGQSYTTTLTATGSYTLNTVTVTMGGVDITSTAYSSGTITIPSVTGNIVITATAVLAAQSITAVYTQSGTVYDTDSLDSLKVDLVVTANYAGGTSETVPSSDYTLSGTLTEGTSTITVSYAGLTDTFNVTVSSAPVDILASNTWTAGYRLVNGQPSELGNCAITADYFSVEGFSEIDAEQIRANIPCGLGIAFYTKNGEEYTYVSPQLSFTINNDNQSHTFTIPQNVTYARVATTIYNSEIVPTDAITLVMH